MELDNAIAKRISVKSYTDEDVPNDVIGLILEAGTLAPSAGNLQNWKFVVVRKESTRADLAAASRNQNWMNQAPIHIVVCNDKKQKNG